ncbi:MAG: hypothetical protein AAF657_13595 [Acidobacteriota bacterium]
MQRAQQQNLPVRRRASRRVASQWACALISTLLLAATGQAQPSAEGAVSTLDDKPKASTQDPYFTTACALTADDLLTGHDCEGALNCQTAQSCDVVGGLDHVAAGVGLRHRSSGTIELAGAPPGAIAAGAWLYWGLIVDDGDLGQHDPSAVVFDGETMSGELVGTAPTPCWFGDAVGSLEFRAYRRSVLHLLVPGINGAYQVKVPSTSVIDGRDPWRGEPVPPPWVDGASLVVLYTHPHVPYGSRVYLHHGAALLVGALGLEHDLLPIEPIGHVDTVLRHTRLGGDGQRQAGYLPTYPLLTSLDWSESCLQTRLQIRGPGSAVDPVSDWKGYDGGSITQLWDTQTNEFLLIPDGPACTSYQVLYETLDPPPGSGTGTGATSGFLHDCIVVVAHALTLR